MFARQAGSPAGIALGRRLTEKYGKRWENDWEAEAYLPNDHGTEDSVITV